MHCTYCSVAHGREDAVSTGVKGSFDHPFLTPGDSDDGDSAFRSNSIGELNQPSLVRWTQVDDEGAIRHSNLYP